MARRVRIDVRVVQCTHLNPLHKFSQDSFLHDQRKSESSPVLPNPAKKCEAQMIKSSLSSLPTNQLFILSTTHSPSLQISCMTRSSFGHSTTARPIAVFTNPIVLFNLFRSSSEFAQFRGGRENSRKSSKLLRSVDCGEGSEL